MQGIFETTPPTDMKTFHFPLLVVLTVGLHLQGYLNFTTAVPYDKPTATSEVQEEGAKPVIAFDSMEHDFGKIAFRSEPQTFTFRFRNDGNAPLVVTRTEQSCTCLSVNYPRKPVMPGGEGEVEITYSPKKDKGAFNNYVKIFSNSATGNPTLLFVRGEVVE